MDKLAEVQRAAFLGAHFPSMSQYRPPCYKPETEDHILKVPEYKDPTFIIPDDNGLGYEDGIRVLRALGSWPAEMTPNSGPAMTAPVAAPSRMDQLGGQQQAAGAGLSKKSFSGYQGGGGGGGGKKCKEQEVGGGRQANENGGGKNFVCPVCGKALARKDGLVIHMRIHSGEKPYVCGVCSKAFARRDRLVIHMNKQRHHPPGEGGGGGVPKKDAKPKKTKEAGQPAAAAASWPCDLCGQVFAGRDDWSAHCKGHLHPPHHPSHHHPAHHHPPHHQSAYHPPPQEPFSYYPPFPSKSFFNHVRPHLPLEVPRP